MNQPAGWYADPRQSGQRRWWDGSAWTDHTLADGNNAQGLFQIGMGMPVLQGKCSTTTPCSGQFARRAA